MQEMSLVLSIIKYLNGIMLIRYFLITMQKSDLKKFREQSVNHNEV